MSLFEPRCMVCGSPLNKGAPFEKDVRQSEVCSDECFEIYMFDEDEEVKEHWPCPECKYSFGHKVDCYEGMRRRNQPKEE